MTHFWLTDTDGTQYIYNPGSPDHGSCSLDGINWDRPVDDAHLSQRQILMDRIMERIEANREEERKRYADWDARRNDLLDLGQSQAYRDYIASANSRERDDQAERQRLADLQDETLANHIGNMQTPEEAAAERERQEQNLKTIKAMRKELTRNTVSENMVAVLGCALFAVCLAGGTTLVVLCIDAIIKTVRAW